MWFWILAACDPSPPVAVIDDDIATTPTAIPTEVPPTPEDTGEPVEDCVPVADPPLTWLDPWPEVGTPQADGSYLFTGDHGVSQGADPWDTTLLFETNGSVMQVRNEGGTIAWKGTVPGSGEFWVYRRRGSFEEPVDLGTVRSSFAVHPSGTVVTHGEVDITAMDPNGVVTTVDDQAIWDVAYDADFDRLWVATWSGLEWLPVDADGVPDFRAEPVVVSTDAYVDIEVDRCGNLYGVRWDSPFAIFGDAVVDRLSPDGTVLVLAGRREFLGELRLSRDGSGVLSAHAGGYNSDTVRMEWEVGLDAP